MLMSHYLNFLPKGACDMSKKTGYLPISSGLRVKNSLLRCCVMGLDEREKEIAQFAPTTERSRSEGAGV
jgi:hypothetical protein